MSTLGARRRLVLVRHAKSRYPYGVPDHERPLAGKGMRNAQAAANWLRDEGPDVDLVLCSDAVRTRQTWQLLAAAFSHPMPVKEDRRLYAAGAADVMTVIRGVDPAAHTVMVVGHEPAMSDTVLALAGPGSDTAALSQLSTKFPTSAIAVLALTTTWATLGPRSAVLERFAVPRPDPGA